jgi:hypothetical protein
MAICAPYGDMLPRPLMCRSCFQDAVPCIGISLPYSRAFPDQNFPVFSGTIKMLRLPAFLPLISLCRLTSSACQRLLLFARTRRKSQRMRLGLGTRLASPGCSLDRNMQDLPSSQETLAPATFVADSHLRPVLRPRSNLSSSPSRRFDAVPGLFNARDFDDAVIFGALSHGSVFAVYASCRRYLRLRNTRFRLVVSLYRSRLRGMGFY